MIEVAVHRRHHGKKTGKQACGGKQIGQDEYAAAYLSFATLLCPTCAYSCFHSLMNQKSDDIAARLHFVTEGDLDLAVGRQVSVHT